MIGRVTVATGAITSFSLSQYGIFPSNSQPNMTAVAADGSLWFTTCGPSNSVGQIVP
jgi:streptogramin lyase